MGLISLDEMELMILVECSEDDCETSEEREELRKNQGYAKRVLPLVKRHHQLLVTLLLLNSVANESLPLFLDSLVPSWIAIVLSVSFILLFGEIVPSAIFTGNSGLRISASLSPLVYVSIFICYPIVAPIAWILDRWLHHDTNPGGRYNKAQLLALLRLHLNETESYSPPVPRWGSSADLDEGISVLKPAPVGKTRGLRSNEVRMMRGAMNLRGTRAKDVMTPIDDVFMLPIHQKLDLETLAKIVDKGHSRIPIYGNNDRTDIRGILLTKKLTAISPEAAHEVGSVELKPPTFVHVDDTLSSVLKSLKTNRSHLAIVTDNPREFCRRFDENGKWRGRTSSLEQFKLAEGQQEVVNGAIFAPLEKTNSEIKPQPKIYGVVALLDIIQQLVDEKLADEDEAQFGPPSLSDSLLSVGQSSRWSFVDDKPVVAEPRAEFGRLRAWAASVRSKFSGRKYSSSSDIDQPLLSTQISPSGIHRKVSFSENVEVVNFTTNDALSEHSEGSEVGSLS